MLIAEKLIHVLDKNPSGIPAFNAEKVVIGSCTLWSEHDSLAKCYIVVSPESGL